MKLSDAVGAANLSGYAIVALLIFFGVFLLMLWRIFSPAFKARWDADARMPLDDDTPISPRQR